MPAIETPPGPIVTIDGRECLYFAGTGYLGLQGHPEVIEAACRAARQYGIGSANSRTAFGTTEPVLHVERAAAAMFGVDDSFYFASGWMGCHVLLESLEAADRLALVDEGAHYSVVEAARASGCPQETFRHCDADDLRAKLKGRLRSGQSPLVLSDGVFAATGAIAPVEDYCAILQEYPGSVLCLDDAHGLAVLGEHGRGTFEYARAKGGGRKAEGEVVSGQWPVASGLSTTALRRPLNDCDSPFSILHSPSSNPQLPIPNISLPPSALRPPPFGAPPCPALLFCGTLSKAVGGFGGIVPGGRDFIERLKARSAYFGGASAPATPVAAATARAIELVTADPGLRRRLWSNAGRLKDGLRGMGFEVDDSPVPIACLRIGAAENMQRIQRALMVQGIAVAYMAAYVGLGPEGGLRLAVFATHTEEMIGRLLDALKRLV